MIPMKDKCERCGGTLGIDSPRMGNMCRHRLNARKRRGLATIYRIVLQNMSDLGVKLTAQQFSESMTWIREQTSEQRGLK